MTQRQRSQQKVHQVHNSIQAIRYGTNDQSPKPQHQHAKSVQKSDYQNQAEALRANHINRRPVGKQRVAVSHSQHQENYAAFEFKPYTHTNNYQDMSATTYLTKNLLKQNNNASSPQQFYQQPSQKMQTLVDGYKFKMTTQYPNNFNSAKQDTFQMESNNELGLHNQAVPSKYKLASSFYHQQFGQMRGGLSRIKDTQGRVSNSTRHQNAANAKNKNMTIIHKLTCKRNLVEESYGTS